LNEAVLNEIDGRPESRMTPQDYHSYRPTCRYTGRTRCLMVYIHFGP